MPKKLARYKNKRHKYLSLLTIMLMMSSSFSGLVPTGQDQVVQAAKTVRTSKHKTVKRRYNRNYASSWRTGLGKKASIAGDRNFMIKPGTDVQGYFVKGKHHSVQFFGGSASLWRRNRVTIASHKKWAPEFSYFRRKRDRGKVGVIYKNMYDYIDIKTMKRSPVSVRLTWMGNYKPRGAAKDKNNLLTFETNKIGVKGSGEGVDRFNVQFISSAIKGKVPISFWDIDKNQAITFDNSTFKSISHFYYGAKESKGGAKTWVKYLRNGNIFLGGASDHGYIDAVDGTVYGNEAEGAFTAVTSHVQNMTINFGHNGVFSSNKVEKDMDQAAGNFARHPSKGPIRNAKNMKTIEVAHDSVGNLFEITPYPNVNPYKLTAEKLAGKNYNGPWKKNLKLTNPTSFYYNVRTRIYWPAGTYGQKYGINGLTLEDTDIDPNLEVQSAKVYYQRTPSDSMHDMSGSFEITKGKKNGKNTVTAVASEEARERADKDTNSVVFNKILNLVIKVKPKDSAYNTVDGTLQNPHNPKVARRFSKHNDLKLNITNLRNLISRQALVALEKSKAYFFVNVQ